MGVITHLNRTILNIQKRIGIRNQIRFDVKGSGQSAKIDYKWYHYQHILM